MYTIIVKKYLPLVEIIGAVLFLLGLVGVISWFAYESAQLRLLREEMFESCQNFRTEVGEKHRKFQQLITDGLNAAKQEISEMERKNNEMDIYLKQGLQDFQARAEKVQKTQDSADEGLKKLRNKLALVEKLNKKYKSFELAERAITANHLPPPAPALCLLLSECRNLCRWLFQPSPQTCRGACQQN